MRGASAFVVLAAFVLAGCAGPVVTPPPTPDPGAPPATGFDLVTYASGFAAPIQLVDAGDGSGRLYVVEQQGTVRVVKDRAVQSEPFLDVRSRVTSGGEQGLLSIAFEPGSSGGRAYASYTGTNGDSMLVRYRAAASEPRRVDAASAQTILRQDQPYANHNGGLALFGSDGMLYFGLGDGGSGGDPHGNGQSLDTLLGKLLRVDVRGDDAGYVVPPDNPFRDVPGARTEIWAMGLRNPWRFSFDRQTGELWIADVGQGSREEINVLPAGPQGGGANLGWNVWEGTERFRANLEPSRTPVTFPVTEYGTHDDGGCAVTGGFVYRGSEAPALGGIYLFGDYCNGRIWGVSNATGSWRTELLIDTDLRITSFGEDATGGVYVVDHGGNVAKIVGGNRTVPANLRNP